MDIRVFQTNEINRANTMSIKYDINNLGQFPNSSFNCAVTFVLLTMGLTKLWLHCCPEILDLD